MIDSVQTTINDVMQNKEAAAELLIHIGKWIGAPLMAVFFFIGVFSVFGWVKQRFFK